MALGACGDDTEDLLLGRHPAQVIETLRTGSAPRRRRAPVTSAPSISPSAVLVLAHLLFPPDVA